MLTFNEHEEAWAARWIANGSGSWPVPEHPLYDEAHVSLPLESVDDVMVFLRKKGQTLKEYRFRLVPSRAHPQPPKETQCPNDPGDLDKAWAWCQHAGLPFPPIPDDLGGALVELEPGVYSSRPIQQSPRDLGRFLDEARADILSDYAILAYHGGAGLEKLLHFYLRHGKLSIFLQLRWKPDVAPWSYDQVRDCFALAEHLRDAVWKAEKEGRLAVRDRIVVVGSDVSGSDWVAPGPGTPGEKDLLPELSPVDALRQALLWTQIWTPDAEET